MDNLFTSARQPGDLPLAEQARPRDVDEIVGQEHILGAGKPLRRRMSTGRLGSVIFYGPPGTGKTTIARIIGNTMKKKFVPLHASDFSVSDIKQVAGDAKFSPTIVFIDEIHRLNVKQQDQFLEHAENGLFDLVTATSVNPYHNLSNALCSRSHIFELRSLESSQIEQVLERGISTLRSRGVDVAFDPDAKVLMARKAGGDARRALSSLEGAVIGREGRIVIDVAMVEEVLEASPVTYDRKGDAHYDIISAFVKSMRGGDADATVYWLAALLHAGEDPRYIARRIVIHASEDVGLADNTALQTAVSAMQAVEKIGMPEARITLAHAALHVCRSPKSNSAYRSINLALEHIRQNNIMQVPNHLRDTHYEGAAPLGRGGYKSPHSTQEGWFEQPYAPSIQPGTFYESDARSGNTFEARSDEYWDIVKGSKSPRKWR